MIGFKTKPFLGHSVTEYLNSFSLILSRFYLENSSILRQLNTAIVLSENILKVKKMPKNHLHYMLFTTTILALVISTFSIIQTTSINHNLQQKKGQRLYLEERLSEIDNAHHLLNENLSALEYEINRIHLSLENTHKMINTVSKKQNSLTTPIENNRKFSEESFEKKEKYDLPLIKNDSIVVQSSSSLQDHLSSEALKEALQTRQDIIDNIEFEYYYAEGSGGIDGYLSEILSSEEKDPDWEFDQETSITQAFQTHGKEVDNLSVECGTTLCKLEFSQISDDPNFIGNPQWKSIQQDIGAYGKANRTSWGEDRESDQIIVTHFFTRQDEIDLPNLPFNEDIEKLYGFE